nr:hypothetical protein GCM10020093_065470 [Planobispora longispora]
MENAIKYNVRDGQVWISCGEDGLVVENTGAPVPPYEVDDLFEPFRRLQGDRVRSARGSGLGLSIVRAIVDAHGGTVTAAARPEGACASSSACPPPRRDGRGGGHAPSPVALSPRVTGCRRASAGAWAAGRSAAAGPAAGAPAWPGEGAGVRRRGPRRDGRQREGDLDVELVSHRCPLWHSICSTPVGVVKT